MEKATYGIYQDGRLIFDDPAIKMNNSRVMVVFLGSNHKAKKNKKSKLCNFFDLYGHWEDNRDADTIIADIHNSRIDKPDIKL